MELSVVREKSWFNHNFINFNLTSNFSFSAPPVATRLLSPWAVLGLFPCAAPVCCSRVMFPCAAPRARRCRLADVHRQVAPQIRITRITLTLQQVYDPGNDPKWPTQLPGIGFGTQVWTACQHSAMGNSTTYINKIFMEELFSSRHMTLSILGKCFNENSRYNANNITLPYHRTTITNWWYNWIYCINDYCINICAHRIIGTVWFNCVNNVLYKSRAYL